MSGCRRTIWRVLWLELDRSELGAELPDTLTSINNLAATLRTQGDLAGARGLQEQVLGLRCRVLGAEHPDTLTSMNDLAATLWTQGDLAGARGLQEQVLDLSRRILGMEHTYTLTSMSNLATTLRPGQPGRRPRPAGACARPQPPGPGRGTSEHPHLREQPFRDAPGRGLAGARSLQEQVLDLSRRVLGAEHPPTSVSAFNLFATLLQADEPESARALLAQHLAWLLERDPATLSAYQRQIRERLVMRYGLDSPSGP